MERSNLVRGVYGFTQRWFQKGELVKSSIQKAYIIAVYAIYCSMHREEW